MQLDWEIELNITFYFKYLLAQNAEFTELTNEELITKQELPMTGIQVVLKLIYNALPKANELVIYPNTNQTDAYIEILSPFNDKQIIYAIDIVSNQVDNVTEIY